MVKEVGSRLTCLSIIMLVFSVSSFKDKKKDNLMYVTLIIPN